MKIHWTIHARNRTMFSSGARYYYWQWAHLAYSRQIRIGQARLLYVTISMSRALNNWNIFFLFH